MMLRGKLLAIAALIVGVIAASVYATRLGYAPIYLTHDEVNFSLQAVSIAVDGHAYTVTGDPVPVVVRSLCVHGDSPDAVRMARSIRQSLLDKGVELRSFT